MADDLIGSPAYGADLSNLTLWLECLPPEPYTKCIRWLQSEPAGVWVVPPADELSRFRMAPHRCLNIVMTTLRHAWRHLPPPGRIIWAFENHENRGLDDFEAEAVFGTLLDIDLLEQVNRGAPVSQIVIAGRLREELIGLSFLLHVSTGDAELSRDSIDLLLESNFPIATIFIDHHSALKLLAKPEGRVYMMLRLLLKQSGASLGLWVPSSRERSAIEHLAAEAAPVRALAGPGRSVRHIRFAEPEQLDAGRLAKALMEAAFGIDSSFMISVDPASLRDQARVSPYTGGAYQPEIFDHRVPSGVWREESWLECPSLQINDDTGKPNIERFWNWRLGLDLQEMSKLLDFRRMEAFFIVSESTPVLNQHYHEYRIYNWPAPQPSPRVSLLDCGSLSDPSRIASIVREIVVLQNECGPRCKLVPYGSFSESAGEAGNVQAFV